MKIRLNPLNRKNWLSYYLLLQKTKLGKVSERNLILSVFISKSKRKLSSVPESPIWSVFLIICFLVLLYIFPIDGIIYSFFWEFYEPFSMIENFHITLWQVYGSVVSIAFVVIFFFFETLSSRVSTIYKNFEPILRQEFYKQSWIQPILFFNIFSIAYVGIIINTPQLFQIITLFSLSIVSICILFAKAFTFFSFDTLEKSRMKIVTQEIIEQIDKELDQKISENILLNLNKQDYPIEYSFFIMDRSNIMPLSLNITNRQSITDINIDEIKKQKSKIIDKLRLVKTIGDTVTRKNNIVGYVQKGIDKQTINMLKDCFETKTKKYKNILELAFDDIQEEIIKAITTGSSTELNRLLEFYYSSIETFLKTLGSYQIR